MNEWLQDNYSNLREITIKVCKTEDIDEIFHFCLEQFLTNKKVKTLKEEHRTFFFVRIVRNNYFSKSSPFYQLYKKHKFQEINNIEIEDIPYEDSDELRWVYQQIEKDKMDGNWYYARLFELFIGQGCSVSKTHKKTTIPLNSVSRDINKYRRILKERRKNRQS